MDLSKLGLELAGDRGVSLVFIAKLPEEVKDEVECEIMLSTGKVTPKFIYDILLELTDNAIPDMLEKAKWAIEQEEVDEVKERREAIEQLLSEI